MVIHQAVYFSVHNFRVERTHKIGFIYCIHNCWSCADNILMFICMWGKQCVGTVCVTIVTVLHTVTAALKSLSTKLSLLFGTTAVMDTDLKLR